MMMINSKYLSYANDVQSGKIVVGRYIKLAVDRYLNTFSDDRYEFKEKKVDKVVRFIELLHHFEGKASGQSFKLESWQLFFIANIYGFYYVGTKKRKVNNVVLKMARKNGKTAFASALSLYHLIGDGEQSPQVIFCATGVKQAEIAFNMANKFRHQLDVNDEVTKGYRNYIKSDFNNGILKVVASDANKLDGLNPSFTLCDEYHAHPNSKVRDVLLSGTGARTNPLEIIISTAGIDLQSPFYSYCEVCKEVLECEKVDDELFPLLYDLDDDDDWKDKSVWAKANPNINVTVNDDFIDKAVNRAINNPADEVEVKTKQLNIWVQSDIEWIPYNVIEPIFDVNIKDDNFKGKCINVGVDLASVGDMTAVAFTYKLDSEYYSKIYYYLPEEKLKSGSHKTLYNKWNRDGYLIITPGNVTDYNFITDELIRINKISPIKSIYYDKYNATQWATDCHSRRLRMVEFPQTLLSFNRPTRELERLIYSGNIHIDNNPITKWMICNCSIKEDAVTGNRKPIKKSKEKKIDGVIALLQSLQASILTKNINYNI